LDGPVGGRAPRGRLAGRHGRGGGGADHRVGRRGPGGRARRGVRCRAGLWTRPRDGLCERHEERHEERCGRGHGMKIRLTIVAATATLLSSFGLYPLLVGLRSVGPGLGAILVVSAAGLLTRWFRLPAAINFFAWLATLHLY